MKTIGWLIVATLMAGPALAGPERGYVEATGGLSGSATPISTGWIGGGSAGTQFGAEVKRHLFVIGELGRMKTLQPAGVEASLDTAVSSLSANDGVDVISEVRHERCIIKERFDARVRPRRAATNTKPTLDLS